MEAPLGLLDHRAQAAEQVAQQPGRVAEPPSIQGPT